MDMMPTTIPRTSSKWSEPPAQPALVYCPHPLLASADRELRFEAFEAGESAGGYLRRLGYDLPDGTWYLSLNGHLVHPDDWERVYPQAGDLITVRARVAGGDDEGGKNPLATILSIALIIVSYGYGAALGGTLGFTGATAGQVGSAIILVGGSLLINAMLPPNKPNLSNALRSSDNNGGTYSLAGGTNRARPYEPLMRVLGRVRVFPDLGARPYTVFSGADQYLIQVFNFGLSDGTAALRLSDFRIGDTSINDYQGVTIEESGPDGRLTLWPTNVDSLEGAALTAAAGWVTRTSSIDTTVLGIEISALLFEINRARPGDVVPFADGETKLAYVDIVGQYRAVGSTVWQPLFDSTNRTFALAYWSLGFYDVSGWLQFAWDQSLAGLHREGDIVLIDNGIDETPTTVFWRWRPYAEINGGVQGGLLSEPAPPEANPAPSDLIELVSKSRSPLRHGTFLRVPKGQYEVRLLRYTPDSVSSDLVSEVVWTQLLSYQPDEADYTGQKRVAVLIKASGQLQGTLDRFNALAETLVSVWDGTQFVTINTSNPAWLMYATLRGGRFGSRRTWGCGLPLDRLDVPALSAFATWCDAKGLAFNAVFDQKMNCMDMLNAIALTGRGSLSMANGKYGVVWDAPNQPVMQVFGLGNIKADTFSVRWVAEKLGDEIVLGFWNRDRNAQDFVRALVPGVTAPANPVQVERFGVDNVTQATREANLIAAAQKYRRRFVTFEADYEGQVIARGDVVALSHDLFASTQLNAWGYSGRLIAGTTTVLTLDRTVVMSATQTNYAAVRFPDGQLYVRAVVYASGTPSTLTLASALPSAPNSDTLNPVIDYVWLFGLDAAGAAKKFKVQDVSPLDDKDVRITLVDENPLYYAAEYAAATESPPPAPAAQLPSITGVTFHETLIQVGAGFAVALSIQWDVAGVYNKSQVKVTVDGAPAFDGDVNGRSLEISVPGTGLVEVTILPLHPLFGAGARTQATHSIAALQEPPPNVPWLSVSAETISWGAVGYLWLAGYKLRFHYGVNTDWGSATPLQSGLATDSPIRMPLQINGAATLLIKAVSSFGVESALPALAVTSFDGPPVGGLVEFFDLRSLGWPGALVDGARVSGDAVANDATLALWNSNDTVGMWGFESALMWHTASWKEMTYLATLAPTQAGRGSMMTLDHSIEGQSYSIEYRRLGTALMWGLATDLMWSGSAQDRMWEKQQPEGLMPRAMWIADGVLMWGADANVVMWHALDGGFSTWPGQLAVENAEYQIRVTTGFGPVRGKLIDMVFSVDAPAATESFNNVGIGAGGSRLPLVKDYRQINSVSGAAFTDGGAAIGFTVEDYDPVLGPLIKTRNAAGSPVAGTFTGFIEGLLS